MLTKEEIYGLLKDPKRVDIQVRETVTSTNSLLKELAEQGGAEGVVLIAEQQTMGRGRLGRSFLSPPETGLYMSILLRPRFSAQESLSITTAAAVAVSQAIERVTGRKAAIKWVNDVYVDCRKVCGILTEAAMDQKSGGLRYAVLGIGINIQEPETGFPEELRDVAGALFQKTPPRGTKAALAAEILDRFFDFYDTLVDRPFLREYQRRSLLTGMEITFARGNERSIGTVIGIDDEARLLVRLEDGGEQAFSAGEVEISKDFLERLRRRKRGGVDSI